MTSARCSSRLLPPVAAVLPGRPRRVGFIRREASTIPLFNARFVGIARESTSSRHSYRMRAMTVQTFRELLAKKPFKPFRLVMSSGQSYDVRHPEMAMLTRTDILVGVDVADDGVPAEFKICSLLHVTAVEPANVSAGGSP